jgi:hypothetical protein
MPKGRVKLAFNHLMGVLGTLLLLFGILSLTFQYSNSLNNNAYAQETETGETGPAVDLGPFVTIGPPNRSVTLDSFSDGTTIYVAYEAQGASVFLGLLDSGPGGRGEELQGEPENVIPGGSDPSIFVASGGQIYIAAERPGEDDIAFVECAEGDEDDVSCEEPGSVSTEEADGIEGEGSNSDSCADGVDNDGDEDIDTDDADCQGESGGLCSDGVDNDGDEETDFDDPDCSSGGGDGDGGPAVASFDGNDLAGGVVPALYPGTSSPQLIFVTVDGAGDSTPSNAEIAASSDGNDVYVVWEQDGDVMFRASHDGGETFGEILNLSNNDGDSIDPKVATSSDGQFVHVTWQDDTPGNDEIFYSRSTDSGETFNGGSPVGTPTNLSNTRRASNDHQLVTEGDNVYVVWVDFTTRNSDIFFRESNDNGESFSDTNNLSTNNRSFSTARDPDMAAQGSLVSVVWTAYHGAATRIGEIIFSESTDNGDSFGSQILVSNTPGRDSKEPQIDYTPEDDERYVAWNDQGGPERVNTPARTYNVLAAASDDGTLFSAPVNLSDAPNNPDKEKQTSQLQIVDDVAVWDPSGRRG